MSTKISKGARLHLLRTVEKLQYPLVTVYAAETQPTARPGMWRALAVQFIFKRDTMRDST